MSISTDARRLLVAALCLMVAPALAEDHPGYDFARYPETDRFAGTPAKPQPKGRLHSYRTRIREGAALGPNFAGDMTVVTWGCGTGCQGSALVDARSGKAIDLGMTAAGLAYRLDSRLLVLNPSSDPIFPPPEPTRAFLWDGKALKPLAETEAVIRRGVSDWRISGASARAGSDDAGIEIACERGAARITLDFPDPVPGVPLLLTRADDGEVREYEAEAVTPKRLRIAGADAASFAHAISGAKRLGLQAGDWGPLPGYVLHLGAIADYARFVAATCPAGGGSGAE